MKKMSLEKKKKLKYFMEQQENLTAVVMLLTIVSYAILFAITKNMFVLLFGYMGFYFIYTKLYKYTYFRLFRRDCK